MKRWAYENNKKGEIRGSKTKGTKEMGTCGAHTQG
jgi:hypothetical protein